MASSLPTPTKRFSGVAEVAQQLLECVLVGVRVAIETCEVEANGGAAHCRGQ